MREREKGYTKDKRWFDWLMDGLSWLLFLIPFR